MCRWLAYSGSPILLEELLYRPDHSLIDQSLHARLGVETTNGDGFGVGWYDANTYTPGQTCYFCSCDCHKRFLEDPHRFTEQADIPTPDGKVER